MKLHLLAAGFLLATLTSSHALLLSFDSGPLVSGTGEPLNSSFRIDFAVLETVDVNGDPLPNPIWTIDGAAPAVTSSSPSAANWGLSTSNALDVRDQPVIITFATPVTLNGFSVLLDNSTLGNLGTEQIQFYDPTNILVRSINVSQSTPGFIASTSTDIVGVKTIVLPTAGFYDNLNLGSIPVPEPDLAVFIALTAVSFGWRRHRGI